MNIIDYNIMSKGRASAPFSGVRFVYILYLLNKLVNVGHQADSSIYFAGYKVTGAFRMSAIEQKVYENVQL